MQDAICSAMEDAPQLYGARDLEPENARAVDSLPDSLLWAVLNERVLHGLAREMRFCEVGTGIGGWSGRILREYSAARGVALIDSPGTVAAALGERDRHQGYQERLKVYSLDSMPLSKFDQHSFDLTFSFSSLLARSRSPESVLKELVRVTKPRGYIVCLVPNMHHAASWNLARSRIDGAERALSGRGTFGVGMPESNLYTRESIEALMTEAGACPEVTLGLPPCSADASAAKVGYREGVPSSDLSRSLWRKIVDIEKKLLTTSALRGTDLLSIARVPHAPSQWGQFWYVE